MQSHSTSKYKVPFTLKPSHPRRSGRYTHTHTHTQSRAHPTESCSNRPQGRTHLHIFSVQLQYSPRKVQDEEAPNPRARLILLHCTAAEEIVALRPRHALLCCTLPSLNKEGYKHAISTPSTDRCERDSLTVRFRVNPHKTHQFTQQSPS